MPQTARRCPDDSGLCMSPRTCKKTGPCWWLQNQEEHRIIAEAAQRAGRASLESTKRLIQKGRKKK